MFKGMKGDAAPNKRGLLYIGQGELEIVKAIFHASLKLRKAIDKEQRRNGLPKIMITTDLKLEHRINHTV